ncbi:MAG: sugar transferase [Candidatus Omnitrophica bacterium]|nr:sugar transferase [Candidatus Omnitrophota bacterium]
MKRWLDLLFSALGVFISWPFFLFIALLIKSQSKERILYCQIRCRENGNQFWMYKFRTLPENAERNSGPAWPKQNDPRLSSLGRFLRLSHLDELPQLFNVIKGEMSLVGPRPERPYFIRTFKKIINRYEFRHRIKPGITGWAQINGYCGSSYAIKERLNYDLFYIKNWSLLADFKILAKTFLPKKLFSVETFPKKASVFAPPPLRSLLKTHS